MKVIVLGAGLVGRPMAVDLAKDGQFNVSIADVSQSSLELVDKRSGITTIQKDMSNAENVKDLVKDFDIVLHALPGFMGFNSLKAILDAKKNVIDIAFFPEDPFLLDKLAKKNGVTAVVDCGVAPGMSNILTGYAAKKLDEVETALTYVGGLPEVREWPYEYKAVFSPHDVIEEYVRPARYIENGSMVVMPALSHPELINFPGIGTLEAFNTDGIRSLAHTLKAKNIKEKTLRYPGHIDKMAVLRETGFFSKEEIEIKGVKIRPLDFTAKLLFPKWKLQKGEADITVMKVIISGTKNGRKITYTYDLFDRYDATTHTHSMARTTGYTATSMLRAVVKGLFTRKGITVPEFIGEESECVSFILKQLAERGVIYKETLHTI